MSISITKWYLDCVGDSGEVFIGYAARVRWNDLALGYSGMLITNELGESTSRSTLRAFEPPRLDQNKLSWRSRPLSLDGSWTRVDDSAEATLLATEEGELRWRCELPRARATLILGERGSVEGLGYVECLETTIPPWTLPIDELRWGRFLSREVSLVWIEWRGPEPLSRAWLNGRPTSEPLIGDKTIEAPGDGVRLELSQPCLLRCGPLVSTAFVGIPVLLGRLPKRMLDAHERKWRSRGSLHRTGRSPVEGWVIHEVVRLGLARSPTSSSGACSTLGVL